MTTCGLVMLGVMGGRRFLGTRIDRLGRAVQDAKIAPVSRERVKNGAWDVTGVGTGTKEQGGELNWSETWVEDGGSESCDDVELWGSGA